VTAQTVCACIGDVIRDLKDEYREAIEQVGLGGVRIVCAIPADERE
jgi:hypothetical protein